MVEDPTIRSAKGAAKVTTSGTMSSTDNHSRIPMNLLGHRNIVNSRMV